MSSLQDLRHDALSLVVVDDARTGRTYFVRALRQAGYKDIRVARSGQDALDRLQERSTDVVIADWLMPGMDGLELTRQIRSRDEDEGRYTGVILATASEGMDALVQAFHHGVDDFLHKPFDAQELIARIFTVGSHAQAQNLLIESSRELTRGMDKRADHWATDRLTGLGNADWFEAQLTTLLMEAGMRGGAVCCTLIDVSGSAIDSDNREAAMTRLGRRLMRAVRPTDSACRIDTKRFGLVMTAPAADGFRANLFERIERGAAGRPV
ncbi:MAG: diguanylate cyclase response regulator, partial [Proteobacteria bacterium SW_6_67_9]